MNDMRLHMQADPEQFRNTDRDKGRFPIDEGYRWWDGWSQSDGKFVVGEEVRFKLPDGHQLQGVICAFNRGVLDIKPPSNYRVDTPGFEMTIRVGPYAVGGFSVEIYGDDSQIEPTGKMMTLAEFTGRAGGDA